MKRKGFILLLVLLFALTPILSDGQAFTQESEEIHPPIAIYTDKWGIVSEIEQVPEIDGHLDDSMWEETERLTDFVTTYFNQPIDGDAGARLAYDQEHLFIGLDYTDADEGASLVNIGVLLKHPADADLNFYLPVEVRDADPRYVNNWGDIEIIENAVIETQHRDGAVTAEIAIPLTSLGVDEIVTGDEWQFNMLLQHEMGTKPLSSWVPIRRSSITYTGGAASVRADVTDEARLSPLFMGGLPDDGEHTFPLIAWEPEQLTFTYESFTEKRLSFDQLDTNLEETQVHLNWKSPFGDWQPLDDLDVQTVNDKTEVSFRHPQPLGDGLYQLQLLLEHAHEEQTRQAIITFDRHGLMRAGDASFSHSPSKKDRTEVPLESPSEKVASLLALIPEKAGFRFTGLPDQPELHPDNLYEWSPDNPAVLTSKYSDLIYPNDEYPEDHVLTVKNRKGETVEYPYYEDESGKRYFISAHMWYKQRDYVMTQLKNVANEDPLGAARLLYRFAEVYEGYVPTNEYPWHNQPTDPAAGPPYHWWGGTWHRWAAAELTNFRHLADAYAIVAQTNAFDVLSDEMGEDVESKIIHDMFEPSIEFYRTFPVLYHNMEYYNALGLTAFGRALADPSYIHEAVEWAENFVQNTYLFDGFFQETTISYHNQSTNGMNAVVDALEGWSDPEGYTSPRSGQHLQDLDMQESYPALKKAMEIPELLVYPDGRYFPTQDTWAHQKSPRPQWDAGSFLLPASGVARFARGSVKEEDGYFGITYDFPSLKVVEESTNHQIYRDSGTVQLEANTEGHHITFAFDVPETETYEIELKPFRAGTYGRYEVLIDGQILTDVNFYGTDGGPQDFESLGTLALTEGTHEMTFQNVGKDEESGNYKMGVIELALLDEEAQQQRDEAAQEDPNQGDPTQLYLTFQPKYGHIHFDPLNLTLFDEGQELLPDLGYTHTFYRMWTRSTLAHNTVVVDSEDMDISGPAKHGGNIEVFAPKHSHLQVMRAHEEAAYPQTDTYSREPWLIQFPDADNNEGYVLDLFRVAGGERHEYTLHGDANRDAAFETDLEFSDYGPYLLPEGVKVRDPETETDTGSAEGHYYGYIYVRDVKKADLEDGHYDLTLVTEEDGQEKANMKITGLVEPGQNELFLGESPSIRATRLHGTSMDNNNEVVKHMMPKMVLRREGNDLTSHFITTMEPYANDAQPRIESIERLDLTKGAAGDIAVKVTYGDTTDIILSSLNPEQPLVVGDMTLQGKMGMIRLQNDEVQEMSLVGGSLLRKGHAEVTDTGSVTGTVSNVLRQAAGDGQDAFITDAPVADEMMGNTLVITHPDGKTHGYKIKDVTVDNGQTVIEIDDMDPGFIIHEDGRSEMLFYPFTEWEGETTFTIENIAHMVAGEKVRVKDIQQRLEQLANEGAFENEEAIHALKVHLTAVARFEQQEAGGKVVKHMNGFHVLLDHQKDKDLLSDTAYHALKADAKALLNTYLTTDE